MALTATLMKFFFIFAICIGFTSQTIRITSPERLVNNLNTLNKLDNGELKSRFGNFGEIPYGKYFASRILTNLEPNNSLCSLNNSTISFNQAIALANDKDCEYVLKAANAQKSGAIALIIYSNDFSDIQNFDDIELGSDLKIPTIIIDLASGIKINDSIVLGETVFASVYFEELLTTKSMIDFELFIRSDNYKSLQFFSQFEQYFTKLKSIVNFIPIYKYNFCDECESSNNLIEGSDGCWGNYCGSYNPDLKIVYSKQVLLENIRQKCIYKTFGIDVYWEYMKTFASICADLEIPLFNSKCSNSVLEKVGYSSEKIDECMSKNLEAIGNQNWMPGDNNSLIKSDYLEFESTRVYRVPTIELNNIKYKGSWLAQHIYNSICAGLSDHEACQSTPIVTTKGLSVGQIVAISLAGLFTIFVIMYCYRRIGSRMIETSIDEKINIQIQRSFSNYSKMKSPENA